MGVYSWEFDTAIPLVDIHFVFQISQIYTYSYRFTKNSHLPIFSTKIKSKLADKPSYNHDLLKINKAFSYIIRYQSTKGTIWRINGQLDLLNGETQIC